MKEMFQWVRPKKSPLLIRIGGNSAIRVYFSESKLKRLPMQDYLVRPLDLQILASVSQQASIQWIIDIGMPSADAAFGAELAGFIKQYIPMTSIFAIEIGNEPDFYARDGNRPGTYAPLDFFEEFADYRRNITSVLGDVDLMGPSYAYVWRAEYQQPFIDREGEHVKYLTFHNYELPGCSDPKKLSVDGLLTSPYAGEYEWVSELSLSIQQQTQGGWNVWGEGSSVSCGGKSGISDTFASALWMVDVLFEMAYRGVKLAFLSGIPQAQCNLFLNSFFLDAPFSTNLSQMIPFPSFYGILFFNQAVDKNVMIYSPMTNQSLMKAWATQHEKEDYLVLLNKQNGPQSVQVKMNQREGMVPYNMTYITLTSDSLVSINGTRLGGQWLNNEAEWIGESTVTNQLINQEPVTLSLSAYSGLLVRISYQPFPISNSEEVASSAPHLSIGVYIGIALSLASLFIFSLWFCIYQKRKLRRKKNILFAHSHQ
jgi:hypothetical protein